VPLRLPALLSVPAPSSLFHVFRMECSLPQSVPLGDAAEYMQRAYPKDVAVQQVCKIVLNRGAARYVIARQGALIRYRHDFERNTLQME
jgi:hypothetical protein